MTPPTRSAAARVPDAFTLMALAAGLAFGHVVAAMADRAMADGQTLAAALFFLAAASASTVCFLAELASRQHAGAARPRLAGWIVALGGGVSAALLPGLL